MPKQLIRGHALVRAHIFRTQVFKINADFVFKLTSFVIVGGTFKQKVSLRSYTVLLAQEAETFIFFNVCISPCFNSQSKYTKPKLAHQRPSNACPQIFSTAPSTVNPDGQYGLIKMYQSWSMLINVNLLIFLFKVNQVIKSLQERRERTDPIETLKFKKGLYKTNPSRMFTPSHTGQLRGQSLNWEPLQSRRVNMRLCIIYKAQYNLAMFPLLDYRKMDRWREDRWRA